MRNRDARIAGLLYVLCIPVGIFALDYLPGRLIKTGDPVATAHAIVANEFLMRLLVVSDIVTGVVWLFVVLALYRLLADVDRTQAALMLVLGAFMQVPIYFGNVMNYAAAWLLLTRNDLFGVFSDAQRDALAFLFLRLHHYEMFTSLLFAGLWLIPFGILVYKSGFLPRTLGAWLVIDAFAWVAISYCGFLAPQYLDTVDSLTAPVKLAEVAIALWLLIMGARVLGKPRPAVSA